MSQCFYRSAIVALSLALTAIADLGHAQEGVREFRGIVTPAEKWEISAAINGQIDGIHFSEGQSVSKGDLLVTLDKRASEHQLHIANSELERARAILAEKKRDLARMEEYKKRQAVSLAAHGDAVFEAEIARLDVETAEFRHAAAQEHLKEHEIRAPADGLISAPKVHEGTNYSTSNSGPIATLVQLDPINVRVFIETDIVLERLAAGKYTIEEAKRLEFEVLLPNGSVYLHVGKPVALGFDLDSETGEGSLLIEFSNPDGLLRPGLPVRIRARR